MMLFFLMMGMAIAYGIEWMYPSRDDTHRQLMFGVFFVATIVAGVFAKLGLQ